ncbi:hypothetical protein Ancab_031401 [Ancistrocladus abbreviatus]
MAGSALHKLTCVIFAFIVMVSPYAKANIPIPCNLVDKKIEPCTTYLVLGGRPTTRCCIGVRVLSNLARPGVRRREVCECLKAFAASANINATYARDLPPMCGADLGFMISATLPCPP